MSLTQKILGTVIALFLLFGTATYAVQQRLILPSFDRSERAATAAVMAGIEASLRRELSVFRAVAVDWGNWSDTYAFMRNRSPAYVAANLSRATLDANGFDIVAFLDPSSNIVWSAGLDPETRAERPYAMLEDGQLPPGSPFRAAVEQARPMHGILRTEAGPAMVVIAPVLNGTGQGPHRGAVLLGRIVNESLLKELGSQAQVPLRMQVATDADAARTVRRGSAAQIEASDERLYASIVVPDVAGRPAFRISFETPRDIVNGGREAIRFALVSLTLVGLLVLLTLLVTLRHQVLAPVEQVRSFVHRVTTSGDLSLRLDLDRTDEFGAAARDINQMVERLAEAQRETSDRSFEAGVGEMARGVLHNIGNALTPVTVHAGRLEGDLRILPTDDIAAATEELARSDVDEERRAKLVRFLQLANDDLLLRATDARQRADSVLRGLGVIQTILHQQSQFSRSAHVLDRVAPAEIVRQALGMVAPAKLRRLQVQLDDSLTALGPLPLPRIVLEQVAQNLVVNACEAAPADRAGSLRVSAQVEETPTGRALHLVFSDDGRGIAPENLERIFRKGFSTKSSDTNSGLGLHWCCNVIQGMGGSLHAASAGPGRGATFHVLVPLRADVRSDHKEGLAA